MSLADLFRKPYPLALPHLTAADLPDEPAERIIDDGEATTVVARALCQCYRDTPCLCRTDPAHRCLAPAIWGAKAARIVLDLRLAGFLR